MNIDWDAVNRGGRRNDESLSITPFGSTLVSQAVETVSGAYTLSLEMLRNRPDAKDWMDWEVERLMNEVTNNIQPEISIRTEKGYNLQIIEARFYWIPEIEKFKEAYRRDIARSYDEGYKQAIEDLGV